MYVAKPESRNRLAALMPLPDNWVETGFHQYPSINIRGIKPTLVYLPQKYLSLLITQTGASELDQVVKYLRRIISGSDRDDTVYVVPTELPNINLRKLRV